MPKFLVEGETTLQWELRVEAEDYLDAEAKAKEAVSEPALVFDPPLDVHRARGGEITGQRDRVLRSRIV